MKCIKIKDCIGCGACTAIDPEHFEVNDEGLSEVVSNDNLESASLKDAMDTCPVSAIEVVEENEAA